MKIVENCFSVIKAIESAGEEGRVTIEHQPIYSFICETVEDIKAVRAFTAICMKIKENK